MKPYFVTVPATLAPNIRVEAESIDDDVEKAFTHPFNLKIENDLNENVLIDDFQLYRNIIEGNVFHGSLSEFEVEEGDDLNED